MPKIFSKLSAALLLGLLVASLLALGGSATVQAAPNFANDNFRQTWQFSDLPVDLHYGGVTRGYTWGPTSLATQQENYQEAPGGKRLVQYFDKARMELTGNPAYPVTNGLLTVELTTGRRQEGDRTFVQSVPSTRQVAGDNNDNGYNFEAPVYATFRSEVEAGGAGVPNRVGQPITTAIQRSGYTNAVTPPTEVKYSYYDPTSHHNVASVFYDYMFGQSLVFDGQKFVTGQVYTANPLQFVFGLPITEAYWTRALVGGQEKDVMVQLFERRVLTYTPSNPAPYEVEMGNIGQHYYAWRYLDTPNQPNPAAGLPINDYSQARAAYLHSGPIPQGDNGSTRNPGGPNVTSFNLGSPTSSWPVYDADKKLALVSTDHGLVALDISNFNNPVERWQTRGPNSFSPVTLVNGVVFVGGEGGVVYAISETDGRLIWQSNTLGIGFDSLIVADANNLYAKGPNSTVMALSRADGSIKWKHNADGNDIVSGPILGTDGNIYAGAVDHKVYAFQPNGQLVPTNLWNPPTLDANVSRYALAYANNKLYAATTNGTLYAINSNGTINSQAAISPGQGQGILTVPAVVDGWVYVGTDTGTIYRRNANNVAQGGWSVALPNASFIRSSFAVVDGYLYTGAESGDIFQVNVNNPQQFKVLAHANSPFGTNPPVVNNGYVIIASRDGVLHLIK